MQLAGQPGEQSGAQLGRFGPLCAQRLLEQTDPQPVDRAGPAPRSGQVERGPGQRLRIRGAARVGGGGQERVRGRGIAGAGLGLSERELDARPLAEVGLPGQGERAQRLLVVGGRLTVGELPARGSAGLDAVAGRLRRDGGVGRGAEVPRELGDRWVRHRLYRLPDATVHPRPA